MTARKAPRSRRFNLYCVVALALIPLAAGAVGCAGIVVDHEEAENTIQSELEDLLNVDLRSTDCPSGVSVERGERFRCRSWAHGGGSLVAVVRISNERADLEILRITRPSG